MTTLPILSDGVNYFLREYHEIRFRFKASKRPQLDFLVVTAHTTLLHSKGWILYNTVNVWNRWYLMHVLEINRFSIIVGDLDPTRI